MKKCAEENRDKGEIKKTKVKEVGKNSRILLFYEIISILPLFEKYLAIYHFLKLEFLKLEFDIELEFKKIESYKMPHETRLCET